MPETVPDSQVIGLASVCLLVAALQSIYTYLLLHQLRLSWNLPLI